MSYVVINAITVPADGGDELAKRFGARAGQVDQQEGFEEFQLLRPADGRDQWLVYTRWRDEECFKAWMSSRAFGEGHAKPEGASRPVSVSNEIWTFGVEQRSTGA